MKRAFHLYDSEKRGFRASVFDLISGDKEPKQTKALAYLFYHNGPLLVDFLNSPMLQGAVEKAAGKRLLAKNIAALEVSAEKFTSAGDRADIVITIDGKDGPLLALIIEAKSAGKGHVNTDSLEGQIKDRYLAPGKFPDLSAYKKLGLVLTKYTKIIDGVVNVTWDQLINFLVNHAGPEDDADLTGQYVHFLTHIGGAMKFYEEEVASLPAGETAALIEKYQVYSCRAISGNARLKKSLFMTFREKGGAMSRLYKLETLITLNPLKPGALEGLKNSNSDPGHIKRLLGYIKDYPKYRGPFTDEDRLFYVFSTDGNIDLPHKPKPAKTGVFNAYYTLKEILTEPVVG
jgi:hypothetical protein